MGTSTIDPVLLTISPSWISLHTEERAVSQSDATISRSRGCRVNLPIVTQDDNTNVVSLQVESHTLDSRLELNHLTGLDLGETEDSGDTISDGDDGSEFLKVVLSAANKWG